mmetsp:Transcript_45978/g.111380  ORF Transcript_45978/g.111380 Transcript_45978/m.111380 type:complete len:126 (+) Transcript_45978:1364-1741(+)
MNESKCIGRPVARVFRLNGSRWEQVGSAIEGEAADYQGGLVVSISGDGTIVAVGSRFNDASGGNAVMYGCSNWTETRLSWLGQPWRGQLLAMGLDCFCPSEDGSTVAMWALVNNAGYPRAQEFTK